MVTLVLFLTACGSASSHDCYDESMLVGEFPGTQEHATWIVQAIKAVKCAGLYDPGYMINFIDSPDEEGPDGIPWENFRLPDTPAKEPENGYHGFCDRTNCMIYVRTFNVRKDTIPITLIHELIHGCGYDHGDKMRAVQERAVRCYYKQFERP